MMPERLPIPDPEMFDEFVAAVCKTGMNDTLVKARERIPAIPK